MFLEHWDARLPSELHSAEAAPAGTAAQGYSSPGQGLALAEPREALGSLCEQRPLTPHPLWLEKGGTGTVSEQPQSVTNRRPGPPGRDSGATPTGRRVLGPAPGPEPSAQPGGRCHALPSWTVPPITARLLDRPANQQLRHRPRAYLSGPGPGRPSGRARSRRSVRRQQLRSRLRRREPRPEPAGTRPALCPAVASENLRASASRLLPPVLPARRTREVPLLRFSLWRWFLLNESTAPGCLAWELPNAPLSTKACEKPSGAPVDGRSPSALPDSWEGLVSPLEEDCSAGWHNQQDTVSAQRRLSTARWSLLKNVVLFPASRWMGNSQDSLWAPDLLRCWSPPVSTRGLRLCAELRCAASPAAERLASAGEEAVWEGSADVWHVLAPRPSLLLSPTTNEKV